MNSKISLPTKKVEDNLLSDSDHYGKFDTFETNDTCQHVLNNSKFPLPTKNVEEDFLSNRYHYGYAFDYSPGWNIKAGDFIDIYSPELGVCGTLQSMEEYQVKLVYPKKSYQLNLDNFVFCPASDDKIRKNHKKAT